MEILQPGSSLSRCIALSCTRCASRGEFRAARTPPTAPAVIALVVPFRNQPEQDRAAQLRAFFAHMRGFLAGAAAPVLVVVAEQSQDGRKFNRGQLLNAGYREAQRLAAPAPLCSVIFHDCDLLPSEELLPWYATPPKRGAPCHIAAATVWRKYAACYANPDQFFGGVTAFHPLDFEACNGYPNDYWGWGLEDDQLRLRASAAGATSRGVVRPPPGGGSFADQDGLNVLQVLNNPALRQAHPHLYNRRFHALGGSGLPLDAGWRSANGLGGLQYEVQCRAGVETLAPRVRALRVTVRLAGGDP